MGALFLQFVLVAILSSGLLVLAKTDSTELLNPSLTHPSLEALIDARFEKLAIPFQDQINGLKVQVNRLEAGKTNNNKDPTHEINKRQVISNKPKTHSSVCESSSSLCTFYHPDHPDVNIPNKTKLKEIPTSCIDLQQLGHKLNGLHLIKTTSPDHGTKIETVFCDFQSFKDVNEVKIGFIDLKSASVRFHVENMGDRGTANQKFTFPSKDNFVNVGNGFDWENQWFHAPYTGTYFFSLSGSKNYYGVSRASMLVRLNGKRIGEVLSSEGTRFGGFSFQFSRKLEKGDKIELVMNGQGDPIYLLYFTGWMLEQKLSI